MTDFEQHRRRLRRALQHEGFANMDYASPNSSVSSLSSSGDIVFSSPALAATRDNEVVIDFGAEEENDHGGIFAWPAVESPAAHSPAIRPTQRRSQTSSSTVSTPQVTTSFNERWSQALAIAMNRESDDPTTSLGRRIAARELRLSQMQSQGQTATAASEPFPTARLVSRTTIPVSEPEPPADLRRLATTREAERQLHYRDWHRLGLLDPSSPTAGSDNAGLSPGRLIPTATYARRRSRFPSALDSNGDEQEDEGSSDMTQRLHRRSLVSDSQLEQIEREREPSSSNTRLIDPDRRLSRSRISIFGGRSYSRAAWYDGANDPNGEHFRDDDTPAARSRYWNARMSSATDDLLALATEILALLTRLQSSAAAERQHAPATPPGLGIPESGSRREHTVAPASTKSTPSPLPNSLESMLLPTPRQRFIAAFKAGPNSVS